MNSHGSAALGRAKLSDVGQRARRRVAYRLLPFVFLLYIVNYIDRVNVSFANLRMSADLGLSDRVYGLGVGMFYITYVLFEIPGVVIVERWSARKWIARIMISWGIDPCIFPGPHRSSWNHLLDTDLREAPFGIVHPDCDFAPTDTRSDGNRRYAHQRLALR